MTVSRFFGIVGSGIQSGGADFTDDYSSTTGWTAVGSNVTVTGGKATAATAAQGNNRLHKALGLTLSDTLWYAEYEFELTVNASDNQHAPFVICAGTGRPDTGTSTDSIHQQFFEASGSHTFRLAAQDATTQDVVDIGTFSLSTTYYPRIERTSATADALSVFTNSIRTTHLSGSPKTDVIPSTIQSLDTIQHHTFADVAGRTGSWTVDNTSVFDGVSP